MTHLICPTCREPLAPAPSPNAPTCARCGRLLHPAVFPNTAAAPQAQLAPHRGELILTLGMLAVFVLPPVLGPVVWFMGRSDLMRMRRGEMDPAGQGLTRTGWACGVGATLVSAAVLAVICVLVGLLIYFHKLAESYDAI